MNYNFLDYFQAYCENTIWLKKIVLQHQHQGAICQRDVARSFIKERNYILSFSFGQNKQLLRKKLNEIAIGYCSKIADWSSNQKVVPDMM